MKGLLNAINYSKRLPMRSLITLIVITALAAAPFVRAADPTPSPTPEASASPAKKHSKKTKAAAAATATPAETSSPAATTAATPAATRVAKKHQVPEPQAAQAPGGGNGQVWVNTETHVFHKEGSKWYGKTKHGRYMSEADAMKEGDNPAKNEKQ
jgi:predicted lipid-binding transport protein (Tim44 family)